MGLYILFGALVVFYAVDCVLSHKLHKAKEKEVELLKKQLKSMDRIDREVVNQRNIIYKELKMFNNARSYVDDGK